MNRLNTDEADDFERDLRGLAATIEPQTAFVTRLESQLMNTEQRKLSLWSRLAASLRSNEPASVLDADGFVVRQIAPTQRPQSTVSRGVASAMFAAVVLVIVAGFLLLPLMNARRVAVPQAAATGVPTAPMTATATTTTDLVVFGDEYIMRSKHLKKSTLNY